MTKRLLFERGKAHVASWCALNGVEPPAIVESDDPKTFDTCAYYRDGVVTICVDACAHVGTVGRAWSYPGYVVDRTPYGVLCHELGHHVDEAHGREGGVVSKPSFLALCAGRVEAVPGFYYKAIDRLKDLEPITGYHDNVLEWFAEAFRLFVTNPHLLKNLRPALYDAMKDRWTRPAEERTWPEVLANAPRQTQAALNKIKEAQRPPRPRQGSL